MPYRKTTAELIDTVEGMDPAQRALVGQFIRQIVDCHDPDVVRSFLAWRDDPCIDSLLLIAASLRPDSRDQLLFAAEDLYTEERMGQPKASA